MPFSLLPTMRIKSIASLTPEFLKAKGISLLMLDFDNTIVPYTTNEPTEEMENWLRMITKSDVKVCVVSNSRRNRVKVFCKKYNMDFITHAKKPFARGIRRCLERYNMKPEECALAGDQVYTDTLGANSIGVQSILVDAIHNHSFWLKLRHVLEGPFVRAAESRRVD